MGIDCLSFALRKLPKMKFMTNLKCMLASALTFSLLILVIRFGEMLSCKLLKDAHGGSRGCAFNTYAKKAAAISAIEHMDGILPIRKNILRLTHFAYRQ